MSNFGSPDFAALRQAVPGQMFGPRHSSPNIAGASSPLPPNVGPIPNVPPPGYPGPHMQLFNPMTMPPFPTGTQARAGLPWGAGVLPVQGLSMTIPPPIHFPRSIAQPQIQLPTANQIPAQQQIVQLESNEVMSRDGDKQDHRHRHRHKRDDRHSHQEDKHHERKHHKERKSPKSSRHHSHERKKSSRSRHRSDKSHNDKSSKSRRDHRHRRSPRTDDDLDEPVGVRYESRSESGAVLIEDREGAILMEDRDSDYGRGQDKLEGPDHDVEDGEIYDDGPYETTYSENQNMDAGRHERRYEDRYDKETRHSRDRGSSRSDRYRGDRVEDRRDGRHREMEERSSRHRDDGQWRRDDRHSSRDDRKGYDSYSTVDDLIREDDEFRRSLDYEEFPDEFDAYKYAVPADTRGNTRTDKYSRFDDEIRHSSIERRESRFERGRGRRGQTGAVLIEDRDDGAILIEDREPPSRRGTVLLEDGEELDKKYDKRNNSGHRGARLIEDRNENRGHAILLDDREDNRGHARLKEDRRDHGNHISKPVNNRQEFRSHESHREHTERERNLERDTHFDRNRRSHERGKGNDKRDGRNTENINRNQDLSTKEAAYIGEGQRNNRRESEDSRKDDGFERAKGFGKGRMPGRSEEQKRRGEAGGGRVSGEPVDAQRGRTGALLLEDKDEPSRDERPVSSGRTGAVLKEDKVNKVAADVGQRGSTFQGQRSNSRTDRKPNVVKRSQERSYGKQNNNRSRSSSQAKQEVRVKRERVSNENEEPEKKRKKVWEPGPNDVSVTKCIRSGSPVLKDDNDNDSNRIAAWVRCSPADLYFTKDPKTGNMVTTKRMRDLEQRFDHELVQRAAMVRALQEPYERELPKPNWKNQCKGHTHHCGHCGEESDCSSSSSSSSSSESESDSEEWWMEEMKFKQKNPYRLHNEIWYNDPNELNYGPLCRCSNKARKFGIRHSIYPGEKPLPLCDVNSNNLDKLYHYRITVSPAKNFIISQPTVVMFDGHEYLFEGFSLFSHKPIPKLPECQVIRFNIIYTIHVVEEQVPENFSVQSLDMFTEYLFDEILELVDIDWRGPGGEGHCRRFHVMPRFARPFPENGKELLSMNDVLLYLLKSSKSLLEPSELLNMYDLDNENWTKYVDSFRHMVVTCPGKRPSSIRIDQLDRSGCTPGDGELKLPFIIHHGVRPPQLSYAGDPVYKKKWREYMKFRHLLYSRAKVPDNEKQKLYDLEADLEKIRMKCTMKREVTIAVSSEGFLKTGIRADICQHAMILPVLFEHLRFHECLSELERSINYQFKDRSLLQLAMTHSSYKINYGTNPDHGRNSLSNCGFRQLEFGDHKTVTQHMRKRGLNILLRIMAKMGHKEEKRSEIPHNERLEFLGDAVVEFVTSTHLYNMFPQASEGDLTLYRGSLVNNAHLAILADKLKLQEYLLYAHGPDLCHDSNLKHAMANCFEALMGALYLDGGIELADRVFSRTCFQEEDLLDTWVNCPKHPLVADEPDGDRHWIEQSHVLQKLVQFEDDIGYEFRHIRLLARAFTQRNVGYNNLTYGHNQRLEFLGDTIMQLICTDYLFKHFPDHHEGHLTLLRSSLVNNKTQSTVATELGMPDFVIKVNMTKAEKPLTNIDLKTKEKADLLEALYGALYVDGGLEPCQILTDICFFPRLEDFIADQEWNDPKSQLQQCCLTLRDMNDDSPDIPIYKVIRKYGPTNLRKYMVAVYFREKRLAVGVAGSKQQAEMVAAETALKEYQGLFHRSVYPSRAKNKAVIAAFRKEFQHEKQLQSSDVDTAKN
ncbi:ribonuclease 3-like [Ruditapes philippinarum]|uniref:ribonuclease 3-like n=1 Tax=Ruditapes philippinarum TaxID=129788 RepID=UPI00295AA208|nr:ribonuclease 3-like [Ruditapes philippinarum]XP_060585704.1 ribonuclease 3-like [Ruditapes philippinarum]